MTSKYSLLQQVTQIPKVQFWVTA